MKKILATAVASLALMTLAYAGETEGTVKEVDAAAGTIMLEDGQSFKAAEGVSLEGIEAGAMVKVTFNDGTTDATAVEAK